MALPAQLLQALPSSSLASFVGLAPALDTNDGAWGRRSPLAFEQPELDELLPDGGLPRGQVVEFAAATPSLATTLSLLACARAQHEEVRLREQVPWCAFIDPSATLYAPGVAQLGVQLERLLVVQPKVEAIGRVAARLVESRAFPLVVIDTFGVSGRRLDIALGKWPRVIRRLSLAVANTESIVIVLTDSKAYRPLPLPVALRLELQRCKPGQLKLTVAKERQGRVSPPGLVELQANRYATQLG